MQAGLNEREPRLKSHSGCDFSLPTTITGREGGAITTRCPGKINWTLRVWGRRPDGYHELESLVSPVTLYDDLTFTPRTEPGVRLLCDAPGVPVDERNLIVKAARRLAELAGVRTGLECRLVKRIPMGGGMGGGSSDAAGTLMALSRLWGLELSAKRMVELAAELGSDVPLFLSGGPVRMRGRGERIEPAEVAWHGWVVLVFPQVFVSTAAVFKALRAEMIDEGPDAPAVHPSVSPLGKGGRGERVPEGGRDMSPTHPPRPPLSKGGRGEPPSTGGRAEHPTAVEWMDATVNTLEAPAIEVCPLLGELLERLRPMAGRAVRVSGSGSTMFTAFDEEGEAERFADRVRRELKIEAGVVRPITRDECPKNESGEYIHGDQ